MCVRVHAYMCVCVYVCVCDVVGIFQGVSGVSGNLILPGEPLAKGYYKWHPERCK